MYKEKIILLSLEVAKVWQQLVGSAVTHLIICFFQFGRLAILCDDLLSAMNYLLDSMGRRVEKAICTM